MRKSQRFGSKYKTFFELKDSDSIYQINPFNQEIEGLKIKTIEGVKLTDNEGKVTTPISTKRKVAITVFRREKLLHSPDINNIPTTTYIFNGDDTMSLVLVKIEGHDHKFPIPMAATYAKLKDFKGNM